MPLKNPTPFVAALLLILASTPACRTSPEAKEANFLKRGEALVEKKDFPRAILEFRNAATAMPRDAEPYYRQGLVYLEIGDAQSAVQAFRRATTLNPKHSGAQLKLAELMTGSQDESLLQEAVTRLRGVFGDSPENPDAIDTFALAEWKLGRPEDAAGRLQEALKRFPTHLQSSVMLARIKLSAKDWNGAEELLKKAVADDPRSSQAELVLGELYMSLGQTAKAEPEIRKALELDPNNGAALRDLGALQVAAKRMNEAELTFKRLSALPGKTYKPLHAVFLYQSGKREAAVAEFEGLAKSDPTDREARTRLVAAYISLNRLSEAEAVLAVALKRNPKDTEALLQRAELRLRSDRTSDAEKDLRTVVHFTPDSAAAHFMLARVYRNQGLGNSQQEELQQALRFDPALLPARLALAGNFLSAKRAQAALEIMDQAPESQKAQRLWILGHNSALLSLGNFQEAKAGIDRALQQGRDPEAVYQDAVLKALQKDYSGSRAGLEELLSNGVIDSKVADLLMQTYVAQKDSAKGIERLRQLAASQPKSAELQQLLGQWYIRMGDLQSARKALESAIVANPRLMAANMALAGLDLREGQPGPAGQKLRAVIATDSKNVDARILLARVQNESGEHAAEMESYRAILSIDPVNLIALNNLAYGLASSSPDEALKYAQQAVEKDSDSAHIQDTLGWVYYSKGLYSIAVRYLKTAVDKEPTPRRQFHLGMCYVKTGDQTNGQRLVRGALLKDPKLAKTEQGW